MSFFLRSWPWARFDPFLPKGLLLKVFFPLFAFDAKACIPSSGGFYKLCFDMSLASSWTPWFQSCSNFGSLSLAHIPWTNGSHDDSNPLIAMVTSSSSITVSLMALSWSFNWDIFMKYVATVSNLLIDVLWSWCRRASLLLVLLLSNNLTKASNIFLAVSCSEMWGMRWSFTESIKILLAFASFFQYITFSTSPSGTAIYNLTWF